MAEGDNLPNPNAQHGLWPNGTICVRLGGYVPNGVNAGVIDAFKVPFDCYVERLDLAYKGGTAHLDAVAIVTTDAGKNIRASADMSADIVGVTQALHADVANRAYQINAGDVIKLSADSQGANESGWLFASLYLSPVYHGGAQIGR